MIHGASTATAAEPESPQAYLSLADSIQGNAAQINWVLGRLAELQERRKADSVANEELQNKVRQ